MKYQNRLKVFVAIVAALLLLVGISEMFFMDLFGIGRYQTKKNFPAVASKMGLAPDREWTGRVFPNYQGTYKGHHVIIKHELAMIRVFLNPIPGLSLNTFGSRDSVRTGNKTIDGFFKERVLPPCLRDEMTGSTTLMVDLEAFVKNWRWKTRKMDIGSDNIGIFLKYGNGHYIPASIAESLIADLISITALLERACPNQGQIK